VWSGYQPGLARLDYRRVRSDLIETFKIINGIYNVHTDTCFEFDEGGRRGHDKKLFKSRARLDIRKYSFSNRIVDKWNSLSENSVNCNTVNTFKNV